MTTTITIPIGDIDAQVDLDFDYDVEEAVERYCNRNNIGESDIDVPDEVTKLLDEYVRQQEGSRTTCQIGQTFEKAVEYAALKAFKKLLGQG